MIRLYVINTGRGDEFTADPIYEYVYADNVSDVVAGLLSDGSDDDIIGLICRGLYPVRNEQPLTEHYIIRTMQTYDMILPYEGTVSDEVLKKYSEAPYRRIFPAGTVITRRKLLRELVKYVVDNCADTSDGFLLSSAVKNFVIQTGLKVRSEAVSNTNPEKWNMGYARIETVQKYIDTVLGDYIELRKQTGFEDCFADENPYSGDFDGRIPVWMCWWQGEESAPELIRACMDSIRAHLPENTYPIVITYDNWSKYVTFTSAVIDRFERGIITPTHLSDILRAELLYRYGGMWIDATYYVAQNVPCELLDGRLFSLAFDPPLWGMDIMRGRWTLSLLTAARHDTAIQFLMEGLWLYWEISEELADYFLVDYVFDAGYRHFDEIRTEVDEIPASPVAVYDLQIRMNQRISERDIEWLRNSSVFYKLNRRNEYLHTTKHGFRTFFDYITTEHDREGYVGQNCGRSGLPMTIKPDSEAELIEYIREINPYSMLDKDGYFEKNCWVSRGIIDDVIGHELKIDNKSTENDLSEYDLIIES